MNLVHIAAGVVVAGLVVAGLVVLELHMPPDAQRLLVKNDFADANCTMEFNSGDKETFSVAKGGEYRKTYKAAQAGFVTLRCRTATKTIESPGSFHLTSAALAQVTLTAGGVAEVHTIRDTAPKP